MPNWVDRLSLAIFPKRIFTTFLGQVSNSSWSHRLIPWYIRHYGIDINEVAGELESYKTLTQFFSRSMKPESRNIANAAFVSPVDGIASEFGTLREGMLIQAKGVSYTLPDLLGSHQDAELFDGGSYITLYLSPKDYHRIHMPCTGVLRRWRHIPGKLFPVNAKGVRSVQGLFTKNERVITIAETLDGYPLSMVKVGAAGVGTVRANYLPSYRTKERTRGSAHEGLLNFRVQRGEELAWFEFGSTVIVIFPQSIEIKFCVMKGNFVQMGAPLADWIHK
jgi:phosphatidylserine decarboxylase